MVFKIQRKNDSRNSFNVKKDNEVIVEGRKFTLKDMSDWFVQTRGFPSILVLGKGKNRISGEGQSGGRAVTNVAHKVENKFVEKLGKEEYTRRIDKLIKNK